MAQANLSTRREFAIVGVMALGFGFVGIDRFLIVNMFPEIARDLNLSYGNIGTITGALAFAWGAAALLMGNISDRIGRQPVLVGALIIFSLLIGASGLAAGLFGLILVRVVMGLADGAYTPVSIAATLESSSPQRYGLNIGIQQMMLPLFGLGLSPLLVAVLLKYIGWRYIFSLVTIPGLILAYAVYKIVPRQPATPSHPTNMLADWADAIAHRNVQVAMGMMLCWLTCLMSTSALLPSYMADHLHLTPTARGLVMSAIGWGSAAGTITLPSLSDLIGRKPVMLVSTIGVGVALYLFSTTAANPALLFAFLFAVHFFNNALITLTVGPVCTEAVPPRLMATASGMVIATGEFFGGGLAPIITGQVAEHFGIQNILWLPIGAMVLAFGFCTLLRGRVAMANNL